MKGTAIRTGGRPGVKTSPSAFFLHFWPLHRQVSLLLTPWDSKGAVWKAPEESSWPQMHNWLEKCVFLVLCVCVRACTDASVFSLFLGGESSHSLNFLSAPFSGRRTETSHEGGSDSVAQHSFSTLLCSLLCSFIKIIIPLVKNVYNSSPGR